MIEKFSPFGKDLFGHEIKPETSSVLRREFVVPPCTVLDTRDGMWQDRKRAWISCGIKSEIGRGEDLIGGFAAAAKLQRKVQGGNEDLENALDTGTSIFDPVICELMYSWFTAPGARIIDPCAGGSVRGVVAGLLARHYTGIELRLEQVEANKDQAKTIFGEFGAVGSAEWNCADGRYIPRYMENLGWAPFDFMLTCPPYFDLEVYSTQKEDLSSMTYAQFVIAYHELMASGIKALKPNRFAAVVISNVRDEKGFYRDLVGLTVNSCLAAGAKLYNEAVLVNVMGTVPVRTRMTFGTYRKLPRCHQMILVFCKGDPQLAAGWAKGPGVVLPPKEMPITAGISAGGPVQHAEDESLDLD